MSELLATCIPLLFFALLIISIPLSMYYTNEKNKKNIRGYLEEKGATDIEIKKVWFDGDRGTGTYNVRYVDQQGHPRRTSCKIRYRDTDIYWKGPR